MCRRDIGSDDGADVLAVRLRAGDPAALAELAERWGPRLYRYLVWLTSDGEIARDLVQETLVRVLKALLGGSGPDRLEPWLFRIATNLARDDYRSAYRQRVTLCEAIDGEGEPGSGRNPESVVIERALAAGRQEAVVRAVRSLAPELREVIILRFCEDQPVRAIASIIGIPEGTVKSRLYRAYRALERDLASWGPAGGEGSRVDG